ncbi:Glu-tRNA(Gln) amidotransferase subunit GatE [Candidatus Pacearchaeota archaeon]|nr:Glu-tRNA(Gln) amidotransferase subunit GatE [Candidatus Pacearchaeota archaeon]
MENVSTDYEKIGLKAGLEIHQQLETNKLFCNCPSILRNDEPKLKVQRKLNPVVGETGEIDVAAEYEKSKDQTFTYEFYDTNCLVELDEEPPHEINQEALKIAIHIGLLLNCKIFPVTQVMRKTVVNGSNTSGFQRTMLLAHDGYIDTSFGKVAIDYVFLEEDSARPGTQKEEDDPELEHSKAYKLDRLGIPLVEIATGPHMHTPEQIKEAALKIGEILRACKVKRGIGTIRQDVNISIKGSQRVEIKGFQDPKMMITTVNEEIKRQRDCLKTNSSQKEVRRAEITGKSTFLRPMPGAARMYPETDLKLIKISREILDEAKATLPKLLSENKSYLEKFGLNESMVKEILDENKLEDFKFLLNTTKNAQIISKVLVSYPKELASKEKKTLEQINKQVTLDRIETILQALESGKISENDIKMIIQKVYEGQKVQDAMKKENIDLESEIKSLMKEKPGLSSGAYMGLIMAKFKGKVNGKEVMDVLGKLVK